MENRKIDGVIFDWAGTTVDYGSFAPVQAFVEVFKHFWHRTHHGGSEKTHGHAENRPYPYHAEDGENHKMLAGESTAAFPQTDFDRTRSCTVILRKNCFLFWIVLPIPSPVWVRTVQALRERGIVIGFHHRI